MSLLIDQAFRQAFVDGNFGLPIAEENVSYDPVEDQAYAEIINLPNRIDELSLNDTNETSGLFRVILRYPEGNGSIPIKTKAEEIMAAYPIASSVSYSGQSAKITAVQRQPGLAEDGWYKMVLTISYIAFITR